jgi:hypothetical protein
MSTPKPRNLGSIYTPKEHAQLLVQWAVRNKQDRVLDLGVGEGVFTFLTFERLQKLGASPSAAGNQIYGSEIDKQTFQSFTNHVKQRKACFPHVVEGDFLSSTFPQVDAVLGNPPYVRRSAIAKFDKIQKRNGVGSTTYDISRLSDLYMYFLMRGASSLKVGGRLAVITADTWLNVRYGKAFKTLLDQEFDVDSLISFDKAIFPNTQVKPVLLFATKTNSKSRRRRVWFIRAKNGLPPASLLKVVRRKSDEQFDAIIQKVTSAQLEPSDTWSKFFACADLVKDIASNRLMTKFTNQFQSQVGVQTLANDFFVLSSNQASELKIETRFLVPFAHSSHRYKTPVITKNTVATHFLFCCSETKRALRDTNAIRYIKAGERKEVLVRGKGTSVIGYQNKQRIQKDRRPRWYDLGTALEKRERPLILLPRVFSRTFQVTLNEAALVAGEPFIECTPNENLRNDLDLCLAILTNSLVELLVRSSSQLYGGGAYTVSPRRLKEIPVINLNLIREDEKECLRAAYRKYVGTSPHKRSIIDDALYDVLKLSRTVQKQIAKALQELVNLSTITKAGQT